ncbi:hypothetical protein PYV61_23445, partial [Roseisolibacter sp. H3M3-2]
GVAPALRTLLLVLPAAGWDPPALLGAVAAVPVAAAVGACGGLLYALAGRWRRRAGADAGRTP